MRIYLGEVHVYTVHEYYRLKPQLQVFIWRAYIHDKRSHVVSIDASVVLYTSCACWLLEASLNPGMAMGLGGDASPAIKTARYAHTARPHACPYEKRSLYTLSRWQNGMQLWRRYYRTALVLKLIAMTCLLVCRIGKKITFQWPNYL